MTNYVLTVLDVEGDRLYFSENVKWTVALYGASMFSCKSDALDALMTSGALPTFIRGDGVLVPIDSDNNIDLTTLQMATVDVISEEAIFTPEQSDLLKAIVSSETVKNATLFINGMTSKVKECIDQENADNMCPCEECKCENANEE